MTTRLGLGLPARVGRSVAGSFEKRRLRRAGVAGDVRWKWLAHQLVAVEVDSSLLPHQAYAAMRDRCTNVLEASGVAYAVTSTSRWQRQSIAIPEHEWDRALQNLAEGLSQTATYFSLRARLLGSSWVSDFFHVSHKRALVNAATSPQVSLFTMRSRGHHAPIIGASYGVVLQRWGADQSWNAPGANETATRVELDAFDTTQLVDEGGELVRRFADSPQEPHTQPRFPIDVVYLWVDGSDPAWLAERAQVLNQKPAEGHTGQGEWLFRDRDELLYSLRSLEENAPWVRKVHLFTANQIPRWLDLDHPKLEVHFHGDVFAEPQALPTYNSHAIGSQIHRIPGLSEHYLVMNDDVFFGRPVEPGHFFTPGGSARFRYSRHHVAGRNDATLSAIEKARHHTADVIEHIHGVRPQAMFAHAPVPQLRSEQEQLEKLVPDEFERTMYSRTRNSTDVVPLSWLHLNHLYLSGKAVEATYDYGYYFLARASARTALARAMRSRRPLVFCLNDGPEVEGQDYAEWLVKLLEEGYPVASAFELPSDQWRDQVFTAPAQEG